MQQINYGRKKRRGVSPMSQRITRLSLIKYMFRVRDNQRHADTLLGLLHSLKAYIRVIKISHEHARHINISMQYMDQVIHEIQKEIGTDV